MKAYLEVIARRSRPKTDAPSWETDQGGKLAGALALGGIGAVLAGQLAQLALVNVGNDVACQEALGHVPLKTDGARTLAVDAQLWVEQTHTV